MLKPATGAIWAESEGVVDANLLDDCLWAVPELAVVTAEFAEATLIVGAYFWLLRWLDRMPVDALVFL